MNFYSLSGLLVAITSGLMSLLMFIIGKQRLHYIWGIFCLSVFVFGLGVFFVGKSFTPEDASFWWRFAHIGAILIPVIFLHFVYKFLDLKLDKKLIFLYVATFVLLATDAVDGLFINQMRYVFGQIYYDSPPQFFYVVYTIFFFGLTFYSHYLLFKEYVQTRNHLRKLKIKFFFIGTFAGFSGGAFNFLPVYGIDIYPYANIMVSFYPIIMSYAILKHDLFNVKVILTETATFSMVLLFLIRLLLSEDRTDFVINSGFFIVSFIVSWFIIKGAKNEQEINDQLQRLSRDLKHKNDILIEIDKHKSDFVSIAAHQLRTPSSIIKNYTSMMKQNMYGNIPDKLNEPIERIAENGNLLADTINAILDISHIENEGRDKIQMIDVDIKEMMNKIMHEFDGERKRHGLQIIYEVKDGNGANFIAQIDEGKLEHVFINLIDNAIKYTDKGSVKVTLSDTGEGVSVEVKDTGRGMSDNFAKTQLYQKFAREESVTSNISGNGLGMYFVKEVIDMHHGLISLRSSLGKGSTFTVDIPKKQVEQLKRRAKTMRDVRGL